MRTRWPSSSRLRLALALSVAAVLLTAAGIALPLLAAPPRPPPGQPGGLTPRGTVPAEILEQGVARGHGGGSLAPLDVQRVPASGPETAGATIRVASRTIKLPEDVYIESFTAGVYCASDSFCPKTPIYGLARGDSTISVDSNGTLLREEIGADPAAFDFLKEALR